MVWASSNTARVLTMRAPDFSTLVVHPPNLFRHAAADHAGAAHAVFFGDHDPCAITGRDPRRAHPARTASDDKKIDVELSHIRSDRNQITGSHLLATLAHLGTEFAADLIGKSLGPLVHVSHAHLNGLGLGRQQLLTQ